MNCKKSIDADMYDENYFFSERCPGWEKYMTKGDYSLSNLHKFAIKQACVKQEMKVMDFGCGRGELIFNLAKSGAYVVGIDYSAAAVAISKKTVSLLEDDLRNRANVVQIAAGELPFEDDSFDRIFMVDVIEHLTAEEMKVTVSEFYRILKKGGMVVIHTPNQWHYDYGWKYWSYYTMKFAKFLLGKKLLTGRNPRTENEKEFHINEQTPASLKKALKEAGFEKYDILLSNVCESNVSYIRWLLRQIIHNLWPLSLFRPLNLIFGHSLLGIAKKT